MSTDHPMTSAAMDNDTMNDTMDWQQEISATQSTNMDTVYFWCRAARTTGSRETLVSISSDDSFGKQMVM
jgi:hypothetical protein